MARGARGEARAAPGPGAYFAGRARPSTTGEDTGDEQRNCVGRGEALFAGPSGAVVRGQRSRRCAAMAAARQATTTRALPPPGRARRSRARARAPATRAKLISRILDCNEIYDRSWIYYRRDTARAADNNWSQHDKRTDFEIGSGLRPDADVTAVYY